MADCKWMQDEICTNDKCPMRADYCPVADVEGVCRFFEDRGRRGPTWTGNAATVSTASQPSGTSATPSATWNAKTRSICPAGATMGVHWSQYGRGRRKAASIIRGGLIDADALKRRIIAFATGCNTTYLTVDNIIMLLKQSDTIDPESLRPQGEWEEAEDGDGLVCPSCGVDFCVLANETERFNYCPNCGARMTKEVESEFN